MAVEVDFIFDEACPNVDAARAHLQQAFDEVGIPAHWNEHRIGDGAAPARVRGFGSPTILVQGRDVAGAQAQAEQCCRIYAQGSGVPPVSLIVTALREAVGRPASLVEGARLVGQETPNMTGATNERIRAAVREQYGGIARGTTTGCCTPGSCGPGADASLALGYSPEDLASVPDGANMGLGCGNPQAIAALRAGETVLDLGSGGGFDAFLAARGVGATGRVIGVDMTPDMIAKARANAERLGATNVDFRLGEIEHLPVEDGAVDVIMSNCVVNLSPDKRAVFEEAFRVLRPGGRLAISDVVATAPLPEALRNDIDALTGCVAGAIEAQTVKRLLDEVGFSQVRVTVNEQSREFIRAWMPGSGIEDFVASATIEAVKPGASGCCAPSCCGPEGAA